jgi:hypothetical protein
MLHKSRRHLPLLRMCPSKDLNFRPSMLQRHQQASPSHQHQSPQKSRNPRVASQARQQLQGHFPRSALFLTAMLVRRRTRATAGRAAAAQTLYHDSLGNLRLSVSRRTAPQQTAARLISSTACSFGRSVSCLHFRFLQNPRVELSSIYDCIYKAFGSIPIRFADLGHQRLRMAWRSMASCVCVWELSHRIMRLLCLMSFSVFPQSIQTQYSCHFKLSRDQRR